MKEPTEKENKELPPCQDCGKPVTRNTPSLGFYCDECWMNNHIFVAPNFLKEAHNDK
jgi:hypothetical protein